MLKYKKPLFKNEVNMKIGNVELKNNLILAPMAGVTTSSFRQICLQHHAGGVCTEMISDKGLQYENQKTLKMIEIQKNEHPVSMQIFGNDYQTITNSSKYLISLTPIDILDVNMGCPVNKVVKSGSGAALLKEPNKIYDIIKSLKENINIPVSIKIRAGWDHNSINCDKIAQIANITGADAITIHGRTRSQLYNGNSNTDFIKMVRENFQRTVIGNGDIKDIVSAEKVFETGVDGIMIGRASMGNPFIFDQLDAYFNQKKIIEKPTKEVIIETLLDHAKRLIMEKSEHIAMIEMRTHACWYLKQIPGTKQYREAIVSVKNFQELQNICNAILKN